jgi:hypothetical protein
MAKSFWIMASVGWTVLAVQGALAAGNPLARGTVAPAGTPAVIEGVWNGTDLEKRTACTHPENEGNRGTYAEFDVSSDRLAHTLGIDQKGITSLNCTYIGPETGSGDALAWSGTYSCTDGKHGTFTSRSILVTANAIAIHLDIQLDTSETCSIEKVIAGGRL